MGQKAHLVLGFSAMVLGRRGKFGWEAAAKNVKEYVTVCVYCYYLLDLGFPLLLWSCTHHLRSSTNVTVPILGKNYTISHLHAWACECGISRVPKMAMTQSRKVTVLQEFVSFYFCILFLGSMQYICSWME